MIRSVFISAATVVVLSSCGANKKLESANAQITQLQANNSMLQKNLDASKQQVTDLTSNNASLTQQLGSCRQNADANSRKLRAVQSAFQEERDKMQKIKEKLDAALADFESKGVQVYSKDGILHVEMADNLLYKSGSAALSKDGKEALQHLAEVLNGYPNLAVIVLGNTDSVLFKKGSDNWSLSTERANGVVRVLRDANVDPARLTSAGKGRYNPVADNSTAEGRAKNRRTDIILNPDIQRVYDSMDNSN
jgi:chemotaxis protein MotB